MIVAMDHLEALAALGGHPHLWRFRELCEDDSDPERRDAYRALVVRMATGEIPPAPPVAYPPLATQAANLAGAFWSWAASGFSMASEAESSRRIRICESCEFFDPGPRRCKHLGCGCYLDAKVRLRTEHCPISRW